MVRISRGHPARVALVACFGAALAASSLSAPAANAGALEQVTDPVEEVVSPVVQAAPSVPQVAETVTTTAQAVPATIAPGAANAPDPVSSPPVDKQGAPTGKAMNLVTDAASKAGVGSPAAAATQTAEGAVHAATESADRVVRTATEGAEAATGVSLPDTPVPSTTLDPAVPVVGGPNVSGSAASAVAPTDPTSPSQRTTYVPPPTKNGATGAPLPRWIAYVWPAVALTGPYLANFGESWGQAITRLAAEESAGTGAEQGVAGVHASGGRPAAAGSSPLFSRLPLDVGHAFSSVPTPVFAYLGLLVLAVIAVALAVRREIALGRRHQGP